MGVVPRTPVFSTEKYREIQRRECRRMDVGGVPVGGGAPIAVQATARPADGDGTLAEIAALAAAGADLVRVPCPDDTALRAFRRIAPDASAPLIAEIPLRPAAAAEAASAGAACLSIRLPDSTSERELDGIVVDGIVVDGIVDAAKGCPLHLALAESDGEPGPSALVERTLGCIRRIADRGSADRGFADVMISLETPDIFFAVAAYRELASACDVPLQLGVHETGERRRDMVNASMGVGMLLRSGIGDAIRMGLPGDPADQVTTGFDLLKALGLRYRGVTIIACPSCSRQQFQVIDTVRQLEERLAHITTPMTLSVIGCVVNGPGEARQTDVGLTGGGKGTHMVYLNGLGDHRTKSDNLLDHIVELVEKKAAEIDAERPRAAQDG